MDSLQAFVKLQLQNRGEMDMRIARVGVLLETEAAQMLWDRGENVFQRYVGEILDHIGAPFEWVYTADENQLLKYDCVIVAACDEAGDKIKGLKAFMKNGGTLVSFSGLNFLAHEFGMTTDALIEKGYAHVEGEGTTEVPLRFFNSVPWIGERAVVTSGKVTAGNESSPLYQSFSYEKGKLCRWAVDIPYTIVTLQQGGNPVTKDGVPALDGTANLDEGILKADDEFALDWELDRVKSPTGISYFPHPYADLWKEVFFSQLVKELLHEGSTLPFKGYWPEHIDQVAMISFDSDTNNDQSAYTTLDLVKQTDVRATWCIIEPGYSPEIYPELMDAGQEIALHYNALEKENGVWSEEEFKRQADWLKKATGKTTVISNKNHYTRFEGWGEFFKWCEENGIQSDESRGPSKKGNIGMLFGTCHPYFPISWHDEENRNYDVLEIGFLTQDLNHHSLADTSVIKPFLAAVKQVNGVGHFLFHQIHLYTQPAVREAFVELIETARSEGFTFWTGCEINGWERERRTVKITGLSNTLTPIIEGPKPSQDLVYYIPVQDGSAINGTYKFGLQCVKTTNVVPRNEALMEG